LIFTALHVMQTRYSEENSVCPSVLCWPIRYTYSARNMLSPSSSLPLLAITNHAARSLCDSRATCHWSIYYRLL